MYCRLEDTARHRHVLGMFATHARTPRRGADAVRTQASALTRPGRSPDGLPLCSELANALLTAPVVIVGQSFASRLRVSVRLLNAPLRRRPAQECQTAVSRRRDHRPRTQTPSTPVCPRVCRHAPERRDLSPKQRHIERLHTDTPTPAPPRPPTTAARITAPDGPLTQSQRRSIDICLVPELGIHPGRKGGNFLFTFIP